MFDPGIVVRAEKLLAAYAEKKRMIVTAESCTGGLVAALLTQIAGSSSVFERGFVTYSNAAKAEALGVPQNLLDSYGAVCSETAFAMAEGALAHSSADIAIAITGIAGPGGGSIQKPVGLVYFGYGGKGQIATLEKRFGDIGRSEVRHAAVECALDLLFAAIAS